MDVVLKDIKNVHLGVYPPTGRVRISAPKRMGSKHHPRFCDFQVGLDQAATEGSSAANNARRLASISTARATTCGEKA